MITKACKTWRLSNWCWLIVLTIASLTLSSRATLVTTIAGGVAGTGYADGASISKAKFNTPAGIGLDSTAENIFVADKNNNAIRQIDLAENVVATFATNKISKPIAVIATGSLDDFSLTLYVLNHANGTNGSILTFDTFGDLIFTNAIKLTNASSMTMDMAGNIYATIESNKVIEIAAGTTNRTTIATIHVTGTFLQGLVLQRAGPNAGKLAVCDSGRNGIYLIDPGTGTVTTNVGFNGVGDFTPTNYISDYSSLSSAKFKQPLGIAELGDGRLLVTDSGNNRVKVINSLVVSNLYGVPAKDWYGSYKGWLDGTVSIPDNNIPNAWSDAPNGIAMDKNGNIYTSEDGWNIIREITASGLPAPVPSAPAAPQNLTVSTNTGQIVLTWSEVTGATNYNVKRSPSSSSYTTIATTSGTTFTDTNASPGTTYYYVVSALNAGGESPNSTGVSATLPFLPVPTPQIGYVTFPSSTSVFNPVTSSVTFNNDASIVIVGAAGTQTFYTYTNTTSITNVPDPTASSASAPAGYMDELASVAGLTVGSIVPALSIKAIGEQLNHPNSAIASAQFLFVTGNPLVIGNNAASFNISDVTSGANLYYTLDGSDPSPTNASSVNLGTVATPTNLWTVSFAIQTNTTFKVRAFKNNYQASAISTNTFTTAAFVPTVLTFGFASSEASSEFLASPGQTFYAPVTLTTVQNTTLYSLQFNVIVTNASSAAPPVTPGAFNFSSMLLKPIPGTTPTLYEPITPAMFAGGGTFTNGVFTNSSENLLGVGWLERITQTNLYNTISQTLITFSQAHDDMFPDSAQPNGVIVGGYAFQVPASAPVGSTYQIQLGRPSGTSDGIGAVGGDVFISAPTNGNTGMGSPINALKYVTVTNRIPYIVGSVSPFRWFNAGDFGSSNIVNVDVEQVFEAAIYNLNSPAFQAPGSDFFDAMDSCGNFGTLDSNPSDANFNYYTNNNPSGGTGLNATQLSTLFDGNDTNIDQVVFGDGQLDICDVYVTFRRGLDPQRTWFRRFWNNGQRVADTGAPNIANHLLVTGNTAQTKVGGSSVTPQVNFTASDVVGSAGKTISVPINATILGSYPLRVLMLNLTVTPLDGSPALTAPVTFNQISSALGTPYALGNITNSHGYGNYSAVWLNSTNAGLTGTVTIGTLNVTIPSTADTNAAYAIHFDHASASPNGLASFTKTTLTGLLTTGTHTNSYFNDGIPDSWRLRWFGTVYNSLSQSNACASGDGINNWSKYIAGVDPTLPNNFPKLNSKSSIPSGYNAAIHWPSVSGKNYVIERANTLFGGTWSLLTTNVGNGGDMEYDDSYTNKVKFYRVLILP